MLITALETLACNQLPLKVNSRQETFEVPHSKQTLSARRRRFNTHEMQRAIHTRSKISRTGSGSCRIAWLPDFASFDCTPRRAAAVAGSLAHVNNRTMSNVCIFDKTTEKSRFFVRAQRHEFQSRASRRAGSPLLQKRDDFVVLLCLGDFESRARLLAESLIGFQARVRLLAEEEFDHLVLAVVSSEMERRPALLKCTVKAWTRSTGAPRCWLC